MQRRQHQNVRRDFETFGKDSETPRTFGRIPPWNPYLERRLLRLGRPAGAEIDAQIAIVKMPAHLAGMPAIAREQERVEVRLLKTWQQQLENRIAAVSQLRHRPGDERLEILLALVFHVEGVARSPTQDERPLQRQLVQHPVNYFAVLFRIDARDLQQQPLRGVFHLERFPPRREMNEDQELDQAPGQILLGLLFKERGDLPAEVRQ